MAVSENASSDASKKTKPNVAVIGAGPAGLMAAQRLAEGGCDVTVFEQKGAPARKFLMAGRGGLNLTHTTPSDKALDKYGSAASRLRKALDQFTPDDMRNWADGLGQKTFIGTSGRVFPESLKASPLLRAWLHYLGTCGVKLHLKHRWTGWDRAGALTFTPVGSTGAHNRSPSETTVCTAFKADVTVLALGGASWPNLGSDGGWTEILAAQDVPLAPLEPSNAGLRISWSDHLKSRYAGAPVKNIALSLGENHFLGEAVITDYGLEGGVCYALNSAVRNCIVSAATAPLIIDLKPDVSKDQLAERLARPRGRQSQANHIRKASGLSAAAIALLREAQNGALPQDPSQLACLIKSLPLECTGLSGLDRAISSAGGVEFSAVGSDFMLNVRPSVFVAGEMLDWEAPTGGYLLQATFATAVAATEAALAYLHNTPPSGSKMAPEPNTL